MVLVYLAMHSIWWLISPLTFSSPSCNKHTSHTEKQLCFTADTLLMTSPPMDIWEECGIYLCVCLSLCVRSPGYNKKWYQIAVQRQRGWSARGYSRCKERKRQRDGDRNKKLECKTSDGRLWQCEHNAMCVSSTIKARGWNPHTKNPIILFVRSNTIGLRYMLPLMVLFDWIRCWGHGRPLDNFRPVLGQCVPTKSPWQP